MAQKPQIIDVTRSYVPGDPNSYPETLISTQREDGEEKLPPVSIYEGYNFMPTPYGYKSYFGTQAKLDIPALTSRTQFILSYQSAEYVNNLIALCEDGIWIIDPTADTNTWKHVVTHTFNSAVFEEWTWCIIENALYCYKQGGASYYHTSDVNDVPNGLGISIISVVPTFLNMAGQMGIFKAGTRLGFWDSANSVAWSSNLELNEFTPSLENLAGNTIFGAVLGRITHVRDHGEGFIVYSTKSIVGVSYEASSNLLWDAHTISTVGGVAVGREVTAGSGNSEQFAWTTVGLFRIGSYNGLTKVTEFQPVAIELSDLLKESRNPVYLNCIDGRFLYLHCIDNDYINGITSFESVNIGDIPIDGIPLIDSQLIAPSLLAKMIQKIEKDTADSTYGATLIPYVADATPFDVIEWEMSFRLPSTLGLYERDQNPGLGAKFDYLGDPGNLDRAENTPYVDYGKGWDNRTPTGGVFIPQNPTGMYRALEAIGFNPEVIISNEIFYDRSTLVNIFLEQVLVLPTLFQVDAFLGESYYGQVPPGSIIQEPCNLNPSYLTLSTRTGNGLLGEMYHIASLWKDYEKRQDLVIKRLQDLCANAEDRQYTVYSAAPVVVGDPALASTKIYKPYGSVGIMPMDKGFFFYKQYREFYDFTLVATRDETVTLHKQVADGQYAVPCTYAIESQVDLKVTVGANTYTLNLPTTFPYSPTLIRDLIESSQVTPISWPDLGGAISFKDVDNYNQLLTAPWQLDGYIGIKAEIPGAYPVVEYNVQVKAKQLVHVTNVAEEFMYPTQVSFKAQREPLAMYEEYPFLMANPGANEIVGYYQSVEQAIIQCSSYCRYLGAVTAFLTNVYTDPYTVFRPSANVNDYYTINRGDYLELHTQVFNVLRVDSLGAGAGDNEVIDAVVMLLRQVAGFIHQYNEDEHLVGSLIDNEGTDLSGSFLTPSLDTAGGLNTFGALFTPKNKISCTIVDGALVPGTSTAIDTYSTLETFALGYLTDGSLSSAIYNIPPTYDEGEYWWYMKDADHIYHSGTLMEYKDGTISGLPKQMWTTDLYLDNVTPHDVPTSEDLIVTPSLGTLPGASYNLQLGVPAPNYPTFKGAFVFDLGLKKWGKLKADYKNLISFSPLNNNMGGAIQYSNFGMDSGIMNAAGEIRPFDTAPTDSWIRIGKIGYYRLGITNLLEVKAMFRSASTGSLTVDTSLDGRTLDPTLRYLTSFTGIANLTAYPDVSGRWHTIKIEGNYDLQYLEVRGTIAGRR